MWRLFEIKILKKEEGKFLKREKERERKEKKTKKKRRTKKD